MGNLTATDRANLRRVERYHCGGSAVQGQKFDLISFTVPVHSQTADAEKPEVLPAWKVSPFRAF
jgi:hypothetical protein